MRDWLNAIFTFIGTSSLTDQEYNGMNFVDMVAQTYNQAAYDNLSAVLLARESASTMQSRLVGVFKAKGADIKELEIAKTNIYLGDAL